MQILFRYTHAYISQANEYHRHYYQQQLQQHQQLALQQQHQQHHQLQQQQNQSINMSLNSTMLLDNDSNNYPMAIGGGGNGRLSAAASISNLSQIGSNYYTRPERGYYARSEYAESRCYSTSYIVLLLLLLLQLLQLEYSIYIMLLLNFAGCFGLKVVLWTFQKHSQELYQLIFI